MNMKKYFNKIIVSMLIAALMFSGIAVSAYGNAGEQLNILRGKEDGALYIHGIGPDQTDRFDCKIRMSSTEGL